MNYEPEYLGLDPVTVSTGIAIGSQLIGKYQDYLQSLKMKREQASTRAEIEYLNRKIESTLQKIAQEKIKLGDKVSKEDKSKLYTGLAVAGATTIGLLLTAFN